MDDVRDMMNVSENQANAVTSCAELDDLDRNIIWELQASGRKSSKEIGQKLKVSDGTIRYRMNKMLKSGLLKVTASINPFVFRDGILAVIGMQLEKRTHAQTMSKISKISGVLSVSNVTGTYDLLVEAFFESRRELQYFLVDELSQIGGINKTDTFIVLDSLKKWVELPRL